MTSITFWQNTLSIHQAPLLKHIAREFTGPVYCFADEAVSPQRISQGWGDPDYGDVFVSVAPTMDQRKDHIRKHSSVGSVHIFSAITSYKGVYAAFRATRTTSATIGIFSEPGRLDDGFKAIGRRAKYSLEAFRFNKYVDFLLVTGQRGVEWYQKSGYPDEKIYKFGYFTNPPSAGRGECGSTCSRDQVHFTFVGELSHHKGLDILLQALKSKEFRLLVVGSGPESVCLKTLANKLNLSPQVEWIEMLPNHDVVDRIRQSDCLVLPSRYDGWGAVVNEALSVGVPVICSDACGASDLIQTPLMGTVVKANSVESLEQAVTARIQKGKTSKKERDLISEWAQKSISPTAAARYLLDVLAGLNDRSSPRITPWEQSSLWGEGNIR